MRNPLLVPELRELLAAGEFEELADFCTSSHPATVAEFLDPLLPAELKGVLWTVEPRTRALIFSNLDLDAQLELSEALSRQDLAEIVTHMSADERVDLLQRLPEERREALLPALAKAEREDIRRLAAYEQGTAGAKMTSDYATLAPELPVRDAIERLRREAPDKETIYVAYVLDSSRRLVGTVSLRDLMLAPSSRTVADIMQRDVISGRADEDQEQIAQKIAKYDLIALPIVNADGVLVGIVTHDDAIDILRQEHTEDIEKQAGIGGQHQGGSYLRIPITVHFRNRALWIVGMLALQMVSGLVIHTFQGTLSKLLLLSVYMPMIANTGGNTGSQTSSLIIRSLALGEVSYRDAFKVVLLEMRLGALMAVMLGLLAYGEVMWLSGSADTQGLNLTTVAAAIALALVMQVLTAMLLGALLPMTVHRFGLDPALIASPALTTMLDITGLIIYFGTATLVLGL